MIPDISLRKHLRETTLLAYLRATGVLLGLGALLKVVGALQQAALAALYGAGPELDAYFVAAALPNILITFLVLGPLGLALVSSFVSHEQSEARPSIPSIVPAILTGTAALVRDATGAVMGAMIVAAPSSRLQDRRDDLARLVKDEAAAISRTLGWRQA